MIITDIEDVVEGIKSVHSFRNHEELKNYMTKHNIDSCHCYTTLGSVKITGLIEVTIDDLEGVEHEQ